MDTQNYPGFPLLQPVTPDIAHSINSAETILQTHVKLQEFAEKSYKLMLRDDLVILYALSANMHVPISFVRLNFSVKFQKIAASQRISSKNETTSQGQLKGIKLLNQAGAEVSFFIQFPSLTKIWLSMLGRSINQMNFHSQYKPVRKIGKGATAMVYQMARLEDGQRFAAKAFSKQIVRSCKNKFDSFMNEVELLRNLSHKNLVALEGVFESDNSYYIVTECLKGGNLFEFLIKRKSSLSIEQTRQITYNLMEGLAELQRNDIVHRDIKLQNIMLKQKNSLKLSVIDFGLAVCAEQEDYGFYKCGTPGYLSPQILSISKGDHITPASDVFSAGVVLHTLLIGRYLFSGKDGREVYQKNKEMNFNLNKCEYQIVDASALDLLKNMLILDPIKRMKASQCLNHPFLKKAERIEEKMEISPASTSQDYHF